MNIIPLLIKPARVLLVLLSVFPTLTAASATIYYVDPNGVNSSGRDGSFSQPWASLSYACGKVTSYGDTIHINPGSYADNAQCNLPAGVNIEGAGKTQVIITSYLSDWYIYAGSDSFINGNQSITGFTLIGGPSSSDRRLHHGIKVLRRNNVTIHNIKFQNIRSPDLSGGAITVEGSITWSQDSETPPAQWVTGCSIHHCEFYDVAYHASGNNNQPALILIGVEGTDIYNNVFDESNTDGQNIKAVYGWLRKVKIHDNVFRVADQSIPRAEHIIIELWNVCEDTQIYNNKFYNGYLSFNSGQKLNGKYTMLFHDNEIYDSPLSEFSMDDCVIYNNYFQGSLGSAWGGGVGLWQTWGSARSEVHNWTVRNNVFYNTKANAINIQDKGQPFIVNGVYIYNNVIDTVQGVGIDISCSSDSTYSDFRINNNIIANSTSAIRKSCSIDLYDVSYNAYNLNGAKSSGTRPDPFYRPTLNQDIVDKGIYVGLPFSGSNPDIGAYEYGGEYQVTPTPPRSLKVKPN